jgi:molybdopterin molybdotransferase
MLSFEEALSRIRAEAPRLSSERVALSEAAGRVLAEPLVCSTAVPAFNHSAMDGYALNGCDLVGDGPWTLPVRGISRTGHASADLHTGTACRIFTGARLPDRADTVALQEQVERIGDEIRLSRRPSPGEHVRSRGEDLRAGDIALEAGTRLGPAQLAVAAALDRAEVHVAMRPRVTIVCTGDELRPPGTSGPPETIPDANSLALEAMAARVGAVSRVAPLVGDERPDLVTVVRDAMETSDVIATVGGVSVGDHDEVRDALSEAGIEIGFWKVRIKPGKPLVYGRAGSIRVLGLPGNPTSAQVTFGLFGLPLLRDLQGERWSRPFVHRARLGTSLRHKPGRLTFVRARWDGDRVHALHHQASGSVISMGHANALIMVPEDQAQLPEGAEVGVLRLDEL